MISQCTEKSLNVISKCCKLCLYIGLCVYVCALHIGMRGRKKMLYFSPVLLLLLLLSLLVGVRPKRCAVAELIYV